MMNWVLFGIGIYVIIMSLLSSVDSMLANFLFKVIPALCGLFLIIYSLKMLNIL